tara:strand:+ start:148 stop:990 length:843 start_codon:yes stop_codon:yes gene_type:complete
MTEDVTVEGDNLIQTEEPAGEATWQTDHLPEDLRDNETLSKFKDVGSLGNSYLELQKMVGSRDKIPTEESSEEEINSFYNKLGRPETPDSYNIKVPDQGGMAVPYDEKLYSEFLTTAHKSGLTNKQAQDAIDFYAKMNEESDINSTASMQQSKVNAETALKKEWGARDYEKNLAISRRAFNRFADDDLKKFVEETGVSNNVAMVRFLHKIGKSFSDPDMGGTGKNAGSVDSDSAKLEIDAMMKDKGHKFHEALFDPTNVKHEEAIEYRDRLYDLVYQEDE